MARFLFVVPPFVGHVNPTVSIGQELASRGHTVAWVSYSGIKPLLPDDAKLFEVPTTILDETINDLRRSAGAPWLVGMKVLWQEVIIPLARDMLPGVEAAIDVFRPTALIVDQQAVAGALAARRAGIPWASSAPSAELMTSILDDFPRVRDWIISLFATLQRDAGLQPVDWPDRSPQLVILYTTAALAGEHLTFPPHYRFVGPALGRRPERVTFPWHALNDGPRLFVTLGTVFADQGERFFRNVVEALAGEPCQVIVGTPPELINPVPRNFIVQRWVPMTDLLPRVDAVLCHAGAIVNESLLHGLPLVVAPIANDQSTYAQQIVAAGAGIRVSFNRTTPDLLRRAVFDVLNNPSYKEAARRVGDSFRAAGGAVAAADALEALI